MSVGGAIQTVLRLTGVSALLAAVGGPILDKELRVTSRRRFTYILRAVYVALLAGFIALAWAGAFHGARGTPLYIAAEMAAAGKIITATLAVFQFLTLPLVAILVLAGSISEEIDRRTLGVLLATPVTAFQVVTGKLASRLLHLVLLLAAGVPVMLMIRVMGGVPAEYIPATTGVTFTAILFFGMLTLYLSIGDRRPWRVTLKAVAVLGVWLVLLPMMGIMIIPETGREAAAKLVSYVNPPLAMIRVTWGQLWPGGRMGAPPMPDWYIHCLVMLGLAALLFIRSVFKVRRVALAQAAGGEGEGRAFRKQGAIRRVFGAPVIWKELRRRSGRRRLWAVVLQVALLAALVGTYLVLGKDLDAQDTQLLYGVILFIVGILVTAVLAAPALTSEKESQTLPILLATPLTGAEIVLGKAVGILWRSLMVWGLLVVHLVVAAALGYQSAWAVIHAAILAAGTAAFLVGSGLFFSATMKKSTSAVVLTLMLPLMAWAVLPAVLALANEVFSFGRETVELVMCFDPGILMGIVVVGGRRGGAGGEPHYQWPAAMGHLSMIESTMVILMIAATYAAIGAVLAVLAADRLRTRTRRIKK